MVAALNREEDIYQAVIDGLFEIDTQGRIWRVAVRRGNRWNADTITTPCTRRRAENRTGSGYLQVRVMQGGCRIHALAHRLVWRHFRGQIPDNMTINHIDGTKDRNNLENLELATLSEQQIHALHILGRGRTDRCGERNAMAKLTTEQVAEIRQRRASGKPLKAIAADFGVSDRTVSKIARGSRWAA